MGEEEAPQSAAGLLGRDRLIYKEGNESKTVCMT